MHPGSCDTPASSCIRTVHGRRPGCIATWCFAARTWGLWSRWLHLIGAMGCDSCTKQRNPNFAFPWKEEMSTKGCIEVAQRARWEVYSAHLLLPIHKCTLQNQIFKVLTSSVFYAPLRSAGSHLIFGDDVVSLILALLCQSALTSISAQCRVVRKELCKVLVSHSEF